MNNKLIAAAAVVVAVFLIGFLPMYVKANRLDSELRLCSEARAGAALRDLIGLAYVQTNQKNYGLAADSASLFFNRAREAANQTQDAGRRKALEELLGPRDRVTAQLAKGDPAALSELEQVFVKTRQATLTSSEP